MCVCVCVSIYSYTWVCVRVWLHIADSVFFFCFQGRIITPLSLSSPPLPVPPSIPSPLSAPCLSLLSGFFFRAVHIDPPPLTSPHPTPAPPSSFLSDSFAPPVLHCAGLERSEGAERGARREDLVNRGETDRGEGPWLLSLPC